MIDRKKLGKKSKRQGRAAELAVEALLHSWNWDPREEIPDEGYDFCVEVPATNTMPTHRFLIQVKSSGEMAVRSDGSWSVRITKKRLNEYRQHRLPVFIIGINLATKECRWCDVDDEASVATPRRRDRKPGRAKATKAPNYYLKLTKELAAGQEIDETFAAAVIAAWRRRDDQFHPPAVAAKVREEFLRKRDPRFDVQVNVVNGQEIRVIAARDEPVTLDASLRFATRDGAEALQDTFRFGIPATVKTAEFRLEGSDLFRDMPSSGELSVGAHPQRKRMLLGYRVQGSESGQRWEIEEDGELFTGSDGGEWRVLGNECPLHVKIRVELVKQRLTLSYSLQRAVWNGKDVRRLPFLAPLLSLMDGALTSGGISLGVRDQGIVSTLAEVPIAEERAQFEHIAEWLRCVAALSDICKFADRRFVWNASLAPDGATLRSWVEAGQLLAGATVKMNQGDFSFNCPPELFTAIENSGGNMVLRNTWDVRLNPDETVSIPVLLALSNYAVSSGETLGDVLIKRKPESRAFMLFDRNPHASPPLDLFSVSGAEREPDSSTSGRGI
jgi:hypothetical protein